MRVLSYFVLAAALLVLLPRVAAAQAAYLEMHTGYNYVDMKGVDFHPATLVGASLGYMFGSGFRVESEFSYRRNDVNEAGGTNADGHFTTASLMLNLLYEYRPGSGDTLFNPYIGIGGGGARVSLDDLTFDLVNVAIDDSDYVLAFQYIGGVAIDVAGDIVLTLDYRFIRTENIGMSYTGGGAFEFDSNQSTFRIGLRTSF